MGTGLPQFLLWAPVPVPPSFAQGQLLEGITVNCFIFFFHCLRWGEMAKYLRNSNARDDLTVQVEKKQQQAVLSSPEQEQSIRV